jgi:O-Antigen ligase
MTIATARTEPLSNKLTLERVQTFLVSMIFVSSFYVKFEPAPCDLFFLAALLLCFSRGLKLTAAIMPLFLFLLIYNLAGLFSYILIPEDQLGAPAYLIGLAYTSASGVFIAAYIAADPVSRYRQIIKAYWIGATIGAALGVASYFQIEPVFSALPNYADRAIGGYKDPNVFSTWLVLPVITMLQAYILGTLKVRPLSVLSFMLMFAALFLAFSRGAWFDAVLAAVMMVGFTFMLSPSNALRGRISVSAITGFALLGLALTILLSIPATRDLFLDRFTLVKSYDAGETGRFGNQLNAIPMLQQLPFGFGPYQFEVIFGLAPHNTFLNSFSSAGWIGGVSYMTLVTSNLIVGFRTMMMRTPFQPYVIAVYSCLVAITFQGIQIDTEHWRHLYWMIGITWGFFAASLIYLRRPASPAEVAEGWNLRPSSLTRGT